MSSRRCAASSIDLRCLYSDQIDPHAIGRWQLEMWARILERGLEIRKAT